VENYNPMNIPGTMLMMIRIAVLFGLALANAAPAQEKTYTLNLKSDVGVGKTVTVKKTHTGTDKTKTYDPSGKLLPGKPPKDDEFSYTLTVLSRGQGLNWVEKAVYTTAKEGPAGKLKALPWEGRTVVTRRKDGVLSRGVAGTPPLLDDPAFLRRFETDNDRPAHTEADADKVFLPGKPVAVGASWPMDLKALVRLSGMDIDEKTSKASAKLVKVYPKGTAQFATLEIDLALAMRSPAALVRFETPIIMAGTTTIELAIDGSTTERTDTTVQTITGESRFSMGGKPFRIIADDASTSKMERSAERDDAAALALPPPEMEYAGPTRHTSKDGVLSIQFPSRPNVETTTDAKKNVSTSATCTAEKGVVHYMAGTVEYADAATVADSAAILKRLKGVFGDKLKDSGEIEIDGRKGAFMVRTEEQNGVTMVVNQRLFTFDGKLYQAFVICPESLTEKYNAKKFLYTLRFAKDKK
jgi:hypothetical protein